MKTLDELRADKEKITEHLIKSYEGCSLECLVGAIVFSALNYTDKSASYDDLKEWYMKL